MGQAELSRLPARPHWSSHTSGVPAASSNSVVSGGSVSSSMAATMSGASMVKLTMHQQAYRDTLPCTDARELSQPSGWTVVAIHVDKARG